MQSGVQSHPSSKSKDKQNSGQQDSSGLPRYSPVLKSQMWPSKCRKAAVVTPGSQCCTYCWMHYNALMWLCYMCVLWAKISLQWHRCCCYGFKYVLPVCVLFSIWSEKVYFSVHFDISVSTEPCKCIPLPVFSTQICPFSLLCFLPWLQMGIFVTLCAGFELVCLVGRVTWKFREQIIISGCCSSFELIKTVCEQLKPPILTLPPPLSVDVAVPPVPSRGRDTNLSHVRLKISSQCVRTVTPVARVQWLTSR